MREWKHTIAIIPGPAPGDTSLDRSCAPTDRYVIPIGAPTYSVRPLEESTWPAYVPGRHTRGHRPMTGASSPRATIWPSSWDGPVITSAVAGPSLVTMKLCG